MDTKRLVKTFIELVQIDSESENEGKIHEYLKNKFMKLGLEIVEDNSKEDTGLGSNNLIVRLHGKDRNKLPLFFSCHTDTVSPGKGIEVIEESGILSSKGETILGADDKAGIAIIIEAIETIQELGITTGDLEFVFSPGEEIGLIGASALDMQLINAKSGYVLDSGGEVGRVTIASPTLFMYEIQVKGQSAHSGIEPEKGISAVSILSEALQKIEIGRIDEMTTANIGTINGGNATNIVMDSLVLKGEVRSVLPEVAEQLLKEIEEAFSAAVQKYGGSFEMTVEKMATGYNIPDEAVIMKRLDKAMHKQDLSLIKEISGGGSDANIFNEKGKEVVNLSIGYEKIHTTEEYIAVAEMEKAVKLVIELAEMAS
ncbi:M20/M25/M40 family metallo-hydrolase [Enterococcus sp. T0101B.F-10]|uniref:M20/M25/M40 family metallo-hydrolase n=1 Tax=Enterococcus sp. T0101B.F-10 TaxID=2315837 RepID=UPI0011E87D73|nr:M20/M25/M40 family metallo-hydrolase [Enterococcus sp. T0101B.F-10]TXV46009.1 M20/M25/M40 family metallo-hydrolase [Enterococcus sp. T0101B.F-10]